MAEADTPSCRCSNISIMQLFHELKQNFPNVPDQIVSKIIQQNYHDKSACETLLQRENSLYSVQAYPGAIISGDPRARSSELTPPDHCPAGGVVKCPLQHELTSESSNPSTSTSRSTSHETSETESSITPPNHPRTLSLVDKLELCKLPLGQLVREAQDRVAKRAETDCCDEVKDKTVTPLEPTQNREPDAPSPPVSSKESAAVSNAPKPVTTPSVVRPTSFACDIPQLPLPSFSAPCNSETHKLPPKSSVNRIVSPSRLAAPPIPPNRFLSPPNEQFGYRTSQRLNESSQYAQTSPKSQQTESPQEYAVAVECVVTPGTPGDQQRSFTSVNLTLRPPSVETTLPIDISYGQGLTYTSASFDPRQGYQSHLQIRIGPAGGSLTACRTRVSSPIIQTATRQPCRAGAACHSRHHARGTISLTPRITKRALLTTAAETLLQQQRERKELLARELRKKKERLRTMQSQVHSMKLALARAAATPMVLTKLKADIEQLRVECETLTAAVDSVSQQNPPNNVPLGAGWNCRICTFRNHPLLTVCEECEMPRLSIGSSTHPHHRTLPHTSVFTNNNPPCSGGDPSTSASRKITPIQER